MEYLIKLGADGLYTQVPVIDDYDEDEPIDEPTEFVSEIKSLQTNATVVKCNKTEIKRGRPTK